MNTSGSLASTILFLSMPTSLRLVFGMTTVRNLTQHRTKFSNLWSSSHLMKSRKVCTNLEYGLELLRLSYWNCTTWSSISKRQNLIIIGWRQCKKKAIEHELRSRNFGTRNGDLSRTFWSRIKGNSVAFTKNTEIVGNGIIQGSVRKGTSVVSGMIGISLNKLRHSLLLFHNKRHRHKVEK